jgi:cytidine deaminase
MCGPGRYTQSPRIAAHRAILLSCSTRQVMSSRGYRMPKLTIPTLTRGECSSLIRSARRAALHAYAPYSRYRVGAALLARDGRTWTGANIENASYPLSLCAERTALARALSEGAGAGGAQILAIALAADGKATPWPCGGCRQVISELAPDASIIVDTGRGTYTEMRQGELLPRPFTFPHRQRKSAARR